MRTRLSSTVAAMAIAIAGLGCVTGASAALFEDDDARRAILELRQRVEQNRLAAERAERAAQQSFEGQSQENAQLRRSMLELQNQIEALRGDIARMTGQNEQLARELSESQRRQRDMAQGLEERLRKMEPGKVAVDGREFIADPAEAREFEAALAVFRRSEFAAASTAFGDFLRRYPQSGFRPTAVFWLGNAQYAARDYKGAMSTFRGMLAQFPDHPRAAEAVLSIANCQIELKDNAGARKTMDELVKTYPQSEAAAAAKERLARSR